MQNILKCLLGFFFMTSLRAVLDYVHSTSFEAIIANDSWKFKRMQGIDLLLYLCCYRSAEEWCSYPSHWPPHTSAERGACGKAGSKIDQVPEIPCGHSWPYPLSCPWKNSNLSFYTCPLLRFDYSSTLSKYISKMDRIG